jgi:hypothetical protein
MTAEIEALLKSIDEDDWDGCDAALAAAHIRAQAKEIEQITRERDLLGTPPEAVRRLFRLGDGA